ncbi:MAG: hypothetical protein ACYC28_14780 [Longimicrobiales bacterium]
MQGTTIDEISAAQWKRLASRPVFFGHQSVGRDLLAGIQRVLNERPEIGLTLVNIDGAVPGKRPAFYEANIGANREPATKADAFEAMLHDGFGARAGAIAMLKYCYVDVQPGTDPDSLFNDYARRADALRASFPGLTLVHVTIPLKSMPTGAAEWVKTRIGAPTQTVLNAKRNRYNDLLREHYRGTEPIFDLALLESTRSDGARRFSELKGEPVFGLAPEWTHDGGHLNEVAQRRFAAELLVTLALLDEPAKDQ